ncbi:olfactory receptor 52P1-like [Panthera uncia]|uniref:olfactory receptor 52P1-like n=1 Tax=Panthera uncia TaxID=29064 RepID=UPI0020FF8A11|nr:olfactory receptor 52P1-like [Panthera uncia]
MQDSDVVPEHSFLQGRLCGYDYEQAPPGLPKTGTCPELLGSTSLIPWELRETSRVKFIQNSSGALRWTESGFEDSVTVVGISIHVCLTGFNFFYCSSQVFPQRITMTVCNASLGHPPFFILQGIPGMEDKHRWISVPFSSMYFITILGNCTIIFTICTERSLHKPMFLLLCMLAFTDLGMSTTTIPKVLCIFWFGQSEISYVCCLVQMFFIHSISALQSAILMTMAFDRYVAICEPLRYATILSNSRIGLIGLVSLVRAILFILPMPVLLQKMPFHVNHVIPTTYCEHMAVVKMVCVDTTVNRIYGLVVALLVIGLDISAIASSYVLIIRAVLRLSSKEAHHKAVNTCTTHICVMLISYTPSLFSFLTHRFGRGIAPHVHTILGNLYFLVPPMLNPIIYAVKTKEFRDKLTKYGCWKKDPVTTTHGQKPV